MIFNVLDVFDKLCTAFGMDILMALKHAIIARRQVFRAHLSQMLYSLTDSGYFVLTYHGDSVLTRTLCNLLLQI